MITEYEGIDMESISSHTKVVADAHAGDTEKVFPAATASKLQDLMRAAIKLQDLMRAANKWHNTKLAADKRQTKARNAAKAAKTARKKNRN